MAHYIECPRSDMYNHTMVIEKDFSREVYKSKRMQLIEERKDWIMENCVGGYSYEFFRYSIVHFYFVEASDLVLFKLRWA